MVRNNLARNPRYVAQVGNVDTSKGQVWVQFKFPDGPPVEYERPGVELTEDLEWRKATRPVEGAHHHRLTRVLRPTEAASALYAETKQKAFIYWTYFGISWKDFKVYIGWEEKSELNELQKLVRDYCAIPSTVPTTNDATPNNASNVPAKDTQQTASYPPKLAVDGLAKDLGLGLPDLQISIMDLTQFHEVFRKKFKKYYFHCPRGSFLVLGLIEVYSDRARMTANVTATYDPKQGKYVDVDISAWNVLAHRQHPKGGP